jgi:hypothetical protein
VVTANIARANVAADSSWTSALNTERVHDIMIDELIHNRLVVSIRHRAVMLWKQDGTSVYSWVVMLHTQRI